MHRLLVVSDLYLDPAGIDAGSRARLPPLPALSELLHLGRAGVRQQDWRAGLAVDLGVPALGGIAPAQIAACAIDGLAPGSAVCMAQPVHLVAGMASVHLHPQGLLLLRPDSAAELQLQFAREFGAREQALIAAGDGLLLAAPEATGADAGDPAHLLGSPVAASRSRDPEQQALRRLGAEVEMWLPGLAVNRDRERRGELPITSLWFWGGGKGALPGLAILRAPQWEQAYGGDPWLHGIWRKVTDRKVLAARSWNEVESSALIVASAAHSSLAQLESQWFEPSLRDFRAGRLSSLSLRIGGQRRDLGSRPRPRWWPPLRRLRPWWQVLEK